MDKPGIWQRIGDAVGFEKRAIPTNTIGSSVTTMGDGAGTFDEPGETYNLVGPERFREYDKMLRDTTIVASGTRLFLSLISNAVWTAVIPENLTSDNEKAVAQGYADQFYADIFGMPTAWSTVVRKQAMFRMIGFSLQEWTAKKKPDGTIGFKDIEVRPQRTITRWLRDAGGTVEAVRQRIAGRGEVEIPRSKLVYAVDDVLTESPEGTGLLRHCAETVLRLAQFLELEETGYSTDLRGVPIARAPLAELQKEVEDSGPAGSEARNKASARRTRMLAPLRDFVKRHMRRKSSGILLPSDAYVSQNVDRGTTQSSVQKWMLELLNGDSTSFADVANAINRMNQEIARVLGCEHLLLGADGAGSLALAKSKIGTFYQTVTATLLDLCEVFDRDLIAPYAELNGWPEELWPQMGVNEIADRDLEQIVTALKDLATAGAPVMPNDPAVGEIYDWFGLTRPPERDDDEMLSLNPNRGNPDDKLDPDDEMNDNPEDGLKKRRVLRSRRNMQKGRRAWQL